MCTCQVPLWGGNSAWYKLQNREFIFFSRLEHSFTSSSVVLKFRECGWLHSSSKEPREPDFRHAKRNPCESIQMLPRFLRSINYFSRRAQIFLLQISRYFRFNREQNSLKNRTENIPKFFRKIVWYQMKLGNARRLISRFSTRVWPRVQRGGHRVVAKSGLFVRFPQSFKSSVAETRKIEQKLCAIFDSMRLGRRRSGRKQHRALADVIPLQPGADIKDPAQSPVLQKLSSARTITQ